MARGRRDDVSTAGGGATAGPAGLGAIRPGPIGPAAVGPDPRGRRPRKGGGGALAALLAAWTLLILAVGAAALYVYWPQLEPMVAGVDVADPPPAETARDVALRPPVPSPAEPDGAPAAQDAPPDPRSDTPAGGVAGDGLDLAEPQATPLPPADPALVAEAERASDPAAPSADPESEPDAPSQPAFAPSSAPSSEGAAPTGETADGAGSPAETQTAGLPRAPPAPEAPAMPAWQRFATPFVPPAERPLIAVVITGLGLNGPRTLQAIEQLPPEVSLSFSPYGKRTEEFMRIARRFGHEVLLDLPMEPASADDPGTLALMTGRGLDENMERLDLVLSRGSGYVGVVGEWGGRFVTDRLALEPVMLELGRRGLLYVDNRPIDAPRAARLASDLGVPAAINDRSLDARMAATPAVDASLAQVERIARERGTAVALGRPNPSTLEQLAAWVLTLQGKGLALAPITAVANSQPVR